MKVQYDDEISFSTSEVTEHQWGYAIQVLVFRNTGEELGGFCIVWPKIHGEPSQTDVVSKVLGRLVTYQEDLEKERERPPIEYKIPYRDVVKLLVDRGYLNDGEVLEDLRDLTAPVYKPSLWKRIRRLLNRPLWG